MWLFRALFIFGLNIIEALIKAALRRPRSTSAQFRSYSPEQQVFYLEWFRFAKGYKEGWLYHRCLELGLVHVLKQMEENGSLLTYRRQLQQGGQSGG